MSPSARRVDCILRPMNEEDVRNHARMLKRAFNTWYERHGWGAERFKCSDNDMTIYWEIYRRISPGHCVVAVHPATGAMMGACFYHPREHHVSLGIMAVDPDHFGQGVGVKLVKHIIDFTESHGYPALRLVGSACNVDSFSLYNRAGFIPRVIHQDMRIRVPAVGPGRVSPLAGRVRPARLEDVAGIKALEWEVGGITREEDYRFCIENPVGCLHASVIEDASGGISGFASSTRHPALNMIGPAFARGDEEMLALVLAELERFRDDSALLIVPVDRRHLVEALYGLGGVNVETHLIQVRGRFQPYTGVNLPSFLPETG